LELLKFSNVEADCADKESIAPLLAQDNLTFFSMTEQELDELKALIDAETLRVRVLTPPKQYAKDGNDVPDSPYEVALQFFNRLDFEASPSLAPDVVDDLKTQGIQHRSRASLITVDADIPARANTP
ncbi:MAG: hypothetical protein ACLPQY_25110, partial [Streptosporangiaceae bacterium]